MTADISVVVCAHDEGRWEEIEAALRSLAQQTVAPHEVLVVVDHNDHLLARVRDELGARVLANAEPKGLGGARNTGFAAASGSVVAFMDDDAVASHGWLEQLIDHYTDDDVAGVGGSAAPLWTTSRPGWFPPEFDWVIGCSYLGMPLRTQQVRNMFGCNMSFRRELLVSLGGFRLGYSCDETELCIRLGQRWPEKRILYVPEASIRHHVPASRTRFRRFISRCYFEGGSKAVVSRLVGSGQALSSEYQYTREVLPRGAWQGLRAFLRHGDVDGLARALTIVAGLGSTAAGYLLGHAMINRAARERGWRGGHIGWHRG
jgi:glycosyltransferase involved in cell wall biosynthesis